MAFWSGGTLAIRLPSLIDDFSPSRIDCAAYTLRVGREVFISPSTAAEAATQTKVLLEEGQDFAIPPGQFALVLTEENVAVPTSAVAFISMKAKIKLQGLVNVSGFHVDPGYRGRLLFGIYNASSGPVHLAQGEDAFLIWYASLDTDSKEYGRADSAFENIPSALITPISGPLQSLHGLSDRMAKLEGEQQAVRVGTTLVAALLIALLVLCLPLSVQSCKPLTASPGTSGAVSQLGNAFTQHVVG